MSDAVPTSEMKAGEGYEFDENEIFSDRQLQQVIEDALHEEKEKELFSEISTAIGALDESQGDHKPPDELTQAIAEAIDRVKEPEGVRDERAMDEMEQIEQMEHLEQIDQMDQMDQMEHLESLGSLDSGENENELESALAEMVQSVVDENLFPDKNSAKQADQDMEQFQWTKMMEKAMEMAMEDPEHLISSMNDAEPAGKQKKRPQKTKRSQINLAIQQRLQQQARALLAQQQRDRELRQQEGNKDKAGKTDTAPLPASMLQFTVPTPPTSIPAPKKTIDGPSVMEQFQKFQKPAEQSPSSIAETQALQRGNYTQNYSKPAIKTTAPTPPSSASSIPYAKKSEGSFLRTILTNLNFSHLDSTQIADQISPLQLDSIRSSVSRAVESLKGATSLGNNRTAPKSKVKTDFSEMDEKERIRLENRERKKRWRVINIERNRDNDLRARVIKRANQIFASPEDEEIKKKWVAEEFERRKRKRLEKNGTDSSLSTGTDAEQSSESIAALLADTQVSANIRALYEALNGPARDENVSTVAMFATSMAAAYVVYNKSLSENLVPSIVSSLVNSLNNQLNGNTSHTSAVNFKAVDPAPSVKHTEEHKKAKIDPDLMKLPDTVAKFTQPVAEPAYPRQPRAPHYQKPSADIKPATPTVRSIVSKTPSVELTGGLRKPGAFRKPAGFEKRGFGIGSLSHKD
ncbi:hypothetical protein OGAPHI_002915 [Ogataea philodendri]|uniref:DUF3020 domain-containing protein n=1 Tax=Ogataea philodendri TaxID=1378263 RepID=A0A9P8T6T8_9ASCO|nr:uncharacterized protein OGAPHI_002915 [Ogataea philodendri]KAH3667266.1 hypothetical protein OGAPHI_002915 [Ogataea philodendri]